MPLIEVKLYDYRLEGDTPSKIVSALTDALCAATTEEVREHTTVIVEGVPPKQWGTAGKVAG